MDKTSSPTSVDSTVTPKSRRQYRFLIIFLLGLSMFGSFVNDMFTPSLPAICRFFHTSISTGQLGVSMALLGAALGQFVMGPISDHIGRKPVLWFGLIVGTITTGLCVFSPNITTFLIFRVLQGIGASAGYFLARAIPTDLYRGQELAKFMAILGAINGIAPASAPILGGFLADAFTWKGVFIALSVLGIILLCFSPMLKETLPVSERSHAGIKDSLKNYIVLLKRKAFRVHVMLKGWTLALMFSYISSAPFIIEDHFGFSQTLYGIVIGINAIFVSLGSMLALRFKPLKRAAVVGSLGIALFIAGEIIVLNTAPNFWLYEAMMCPVLFFVGMIFTSANTLAMNEGHDMAGEASAVIGIVGYVFGCIASPLCGICDVFISTSVVFGVLTIFIIIAAIRTKIQPADLDK